jgi:TPR repeat protein
MRHMLRPNLFMFCAATLALVLAGCDVNIEPTDLSAVKVESNRTTIEKALGKPDELVEARGFTVASYSYDKGYFAPARAPTGISRPPSTAGGGMAGAGWLLITAVAAPFDYAARISEARPGQRGRLAAIYNADRSLVFSSFLEESASTSQTLDSMLARYIDAQSGDVEALVDLAKVALIPNQKLTFLETAANAGNAEAAYEVGKVYKLAAGVEQDMAQALAWWRIAAGLGYVPAYVQLGNSYRFGIGVPRNIDVAKVWLTKAADGGSTMAQRVLFEMSGSEQRLEALLARAEEGHSAFQVEVADSYRFGIGVPKDIDLAIRMYERATAARDDYAAYALGNIYAGGETGTVELSRAYMWYSIAEQVASDEDEELRRLKIETSKGMTSDQIAEAERMAREWLEAHP